MAGKLYGFLVGINQYQAVRPLRGCVRDVDTFAQYLTDRFGADLELHMLQDGDATRSNVIAGFDHLAQASEDDVALFMFCGHGAQSPSHEAFLPLDATGLDEGLVCVDSRARVEGQEAPIPDLADKEIAVLLERVSRNNPHLTAIFDCCHSGSGTRNIDELVGAQSRHTGAAKPRTLESYLDGYYAELHEAGQLHIPQSRHILLSACDRTQKALEKNGAGVFSTTLHEVLARTRDRLPNYAQLFADCRIAVRRRAKDQDPQFDSYEGFNAYSAFLGGQADPGVRATVFFRDGDWRMDKGALTGVPNDPEKPTNFVVLKEGSEDPIARGSTLEVGPAESKAKIDGRLEDNETYRVELTDVPLPPLLVFADGDDPALETLGRALSEVGDVALVTDKENTHYSITVRTETTSSGTRKEHVLTRFDPETEFLGVPGETADSEVAVADMVSVLRAAARFERLASLQNRYTALDPSAIDFSLKVYPDSARERRDVDGSVKMVYEPSNAPGREWEQIPILLEATNKIPATGDEETDRDNTRHVALLYFGERLEVLKLHNEPLPPGATVQLYGTGAPKGSGLALKNGRAETVDHFKLFVSTEVIPHEEMEQAEVPVRGEKTRSLVEDPPKQKITNDWFTKSIKVRGVGVANELSSENEVQLADGNVVVRPHATAKAKLNLSTAPGAHSRDVTAGIHMALEGFSLVGFGSTRDVDDGMVLELSDIQNDEALADDPLEIDLGVDLDADEYILPMTFDGEHFLMVGPPAESQEGRTRVAIDHVPDTQFDEDRRSLGKAMRLYLFRTYLKQSVDELAWVEFGDDGTVTRHTDGIADKVAAAKNVLLLIHGIIGDTQNIAEGIGVATTDAGAPLRDAFDLVLTFDYENLGREIEKTSEVLQSTLQGAGFGPDDDTRLTILAHSMGGLVSRHYVEHLGGGSVVDHLVMCGTPNGGSPFGKIDSARKLLGLLAGFAVNVPALAAFAPAVGFMLNRSKKVTLTLEQMNETSAFLTRLNESPDPDVPYTVLAGNISDYRGQDERLMAKLLNRVGGSAVLEAMHGGSGNHDIAVALESIRNLDELRKNPPVKMDVGCHHLNYFSSDAGLGALKRVEW